MNRKGFTLIELLAVILILGIISLIAIPTISNIITDSKKGAFKASVDNVVLAAEQKCQVEQLKGERITDQYVFDSTGVYPKLEVKGKLPINGSIAVNDECEVVASLTNGDITITKNLINDEYTITEGTEKVNDNLISPTNKKVKTNDLYYSTGEVPPLDAMLTVFTENDLREFLYSASGSGYSFTLDENNEVIGVYEILMIPNTYTHEVAKNYSLRTIDVMKKNLSDEVNNNSGFYYYINEEYVFIMEGMNEIINPTLKSQIQAQYNEITEEQLDELAGFKNIKIEY